MADIYHDLEQSPRPSRSNIDPFYAVKEELQNDIRMLADDRAALATVAGRDDEPTESEINRAARAVKTRCKRIEQQVKDLSRTIDQVEKQRSRFPNIDDKELFTRKKFVSDVKAIARETRDELARSQNASKAQGSGPKATKRSSVPMDQEPSTAARRLPLAQQMVEAEQEVHLDDMISSLQRLGVMGQHVGEELEQQKVLLGGLNEDLDDTGDRMENVMRKLDKLIGTSNTGKLWIILFLTILLILLIFVIIYL